MSSVRATTPNASRPAGRARATCRFAVTAAASPTAGRSELGLIFEIDPGGAARSNLTAVLVSPRLTRRSATGAKSHHLHEREPSFRGNEQMSSEFSGVTPNILFGAAYYHEYQPYERLDPDLDLMREAHFNVVRVGESVWSTWEPTDGVYELDWLEPVLQAAQARGIWAILGTPTYAIPAWLHRKYPEIMAQRRTGDPIAYGHRQNVDYSHPAFLFHAERLIRKIVERYAAHPAVIGYQLDNEPGIEVFHNPGVFAGFKAYLEETYGEVEELNRRWGLTYWSHRLSTWEDLWAPDGNTNPGYALAWRRYQAKITSDFIAWQSRIVRQYARPDQFLTTCLAYGRPAVDAARLAAPLDVAAANIYYAMQDSLTLPSARPAVPAPPFRPERGVWWLSFESDLARAIKQAPFLVTETNAQSIGPSHYNYPAYDGQWRLAAWLFVARGARMVEYWHWHTLHYGHEMYWAGVLGHDLEPDRCYRELSRIGEELARAGRLLEGIEPDADITILRSEESRWALEFTPPLAREHSDEADRHSYDRIFSSYYRGAFASGRQARILDVNDFDGSATEQVARWPVLVVPALYIASDELLGKLETYAAAGGHLVLGFRSGYADLDAKARHETMPAKLREAVGAHYHEYTNLGAPLRLVPSGSVMDLGPDACASGWADGLIVDDATILAGYGDDFGFAWPAITTHAHGSGRVTYVGTLLNDQASCDLMRWLVAEPANHAWSRHPDSVTVSGAANLDGDRLYFVSNWCGREVAVEIPFDAEDLLTTTPYHVGSAMRLGPWDLGIVIARQAR